MLVVIGISVSPFLYGADRVRVFGCGKQDRTVVTELATMAPDKLKKKKPTYSI